MSDFTSLKAEIQKPTLFEKGETLWENEHISKGMLCAHLNPDNDAGSRNHVFIKQSAEWIQSQLKPRSRVLDLGCGPGLYCERLASLGHQVTGVDFSKRSIDYAKHSAAGV